MIGAVQSYSRTMFCDLLIPGKEAEFFACGAELVDKARFYASNESERSRIAAAGLLRCQRSGYSYLERMRGALQALGFAPQAV